MQINYLQEKDLYNNNLTIIQQLYNIITTMYIL